MSEPYTGEIRMFAGTFSPLNWANCNGTTMPVTANERLFSLLGSVYGGDGRTTFSLPDMQGRLPVHFGQAPGFSAYPLGEKTGVEAVTLDISQIPLHTHGIRVSTTNASATRFAGAVLAEQQMYEDFPGAQKIGPMGESTIGETGENDPHSNMMPYLCVNFIICLTGLYPQRS